jgi:hypothetical protein
MSVESERMNRPCCGRISLTVTGGIGEQEIRIKTGTDSMKKSGFLNG